MKVNQNFSVINFAQQDVPVITEDTKTRYNWVPVGIHHHDDFFDVIIDAYNTSTTNAACIEGIADMIYGKGLYSKNPQFQPILEKLFPQEDLKRVAFDLKLFGNAVIQVYWNDDHTKVVKMYHTPTQHWRAEKIYDSLRVENYYYCVDWNDHKAQKFKKKVPAYGTSNEKMEVLWVKNYSPGKFYYALPDWIPALQFSFVEAELSNLHLNNIENGFLPMVMISLNNGVPAPEERDTIESLLEAKFTGTRNAGRFILTFNDDVANAPKIDPIQIDNLHDKYQYVADYAQDRILVGHRITSPLLLGIRTAKNGFSSQSEEMKTAYSILQTMTIIPFQGLLSNVITQALKEGGWEDTELYFEQLTPLVILAQTAEETDQTVEEVQDDINEEAENPALIEDDNEGLIQMGTAEFKKNYETYKVK